MSPGLWLFASGSGRSGRGAGGGVASVTSASGVRCRGWPEGQAGEQVGDLVAGQRDLVCRSGAVCVLEGGGDGEGCGGEHGEGDPPVPGGPAAGLVLVQAGQAFAGLEVLFDGPAEPGDRDQGG